MTQMTRDIIRSTLGNARRRLQQHWLYHPYDPGFRNANKWLRDLMSITYHETDLSDELIVLLDETIGEKSDRS
jgi:hypothetical protein